MTNISYYIYFYRLLGGDNIAIYCNFSCSFCIMNFLFCIVWSIHRHNCACAINSMLYIFIRKLCLSAFEIDKLAEYFKKHWNFLLYRLYIILLNRINLKFIVVINYATFLLYNDNHQILLEMSGRKPAQTYRREFGANFASAWATFTCQSCK